MSKANIYEDMHSGDFQHSRYQMVTGPDFGFYQMMPHDHLRDSTGQKFSDAKCGNWKFHLSINPQDVPKAWDIVAKKLMDHTHAHVAKVTKPSTSIRFSDSDSIQAGKHITIYTYEGISPDVYKRLIADIEKTLQENGVRPSVESNADRIIPGAIYTGYRSDRDNEGNYIASSDISHLRRSQRHNPFNQKDPFEDFSLIASNRVVENNMIHLNNADITEDDPSVGLRGRILRGLSSIFGSAAPIPKNGLELTNQDISASAKFDFFDVRDSSGKHAKYLVLDGLSQREQAIMYQALYDAGIGYEQKTSSLNGGCNVLAVTDPHDIKTLNSMFKEENHNRAVRDLSQPAPKYIPFGLI